MPSASGAIVPCQSPWPQAGEEGQKYRSPCWSPRPYRAATISVTTARWVWRTASGSPRVGPEDGAVEGERGLEHHGHAVARRHALGLEVVGEARGPVGELLKAPLLGATVGVLQAERRGPADPAVDALVGEVQSRGIAVEEVPER